MPFRRFAGLRAESERASKKGRAPVGARGSRTVADELREVNRILAW